jgi:hypothetical protein
MFALNPSSLAAFALDPGVSFMTAATPLLAESPFRFCDVSSTLQ